MYLSVKRIIQLFNFIANLNDLMYYPNVLIIPIALSYNHLFIYQLSQLGKRFKEKFYFFSFRFSLNFNI
jgi:hypothetical protein